MSVDFSVIPAATLAAMMLALGMELRVDDFKRLLQVPRSAILGACGQLLLLPGAALALALLLPLAATTAMGLVLLAACPGGATSNMLSRYARGDVALSISLTAISSLAAPFSVPLVVGVGLAAVGATHAQVPVSIADMVATLTVTTAMPVLLGMTMLHWFPVATAALRGKLLAAATGVLVLLVIGLAVNTTREQPDVSGMFARSSAAVTLLMVACATSAALGARWLGLSRAHQRTLVLEVGIQNINLALVVALDVLRQPDYLGPTLVYLPLMLTGGAGVVAWGRFNERST